MSTAERMRAAAKLVIEDPSPGKVVVVSAMGSHPSSPVKVTDLILNMISKAARQDAAFLVDLAALQEKHVEAAKLLLGESPELTKFVARLLDDIGNLKAMLQAICIGNARPHVRQADGPPNRQAAEPPDRQADGLPNRQADRPPGRQAD